MATTTDLIETRPNRDGHPRTFIVGTRTRVVDVYVMAELQGFTPDQIVYELPHLTLAQVHAALAHYFSNRDEIVQQLREEEDLVQRFRASTGAGPIQMKLAATIANGRES